MSSEKSSTKSSTIDVVPYDSLTPDSAKESLLNNILLWLIIILCLWNLYAIINIRKELRIVNDSLMKVWQESHPNDDWGMLQDASQIDLLDKLENWIQGFIWQMR
ncbi:hypothetical protein DASC09_025310 [Saccharomycopsis crataegensis]|uniref:Uncharacterized protein n=1 Tax=Saccharomycopsis crataegensis TaxID=43959 RepID=A0AAV5QKU9_9ASCO|nr:hypothetical protein DASC09_025310 [Saccharomycopsis crataegensis]